MESLSLILSAEYLLVIIIKSDAMYPKFIKANRKASREEEIAAYGSQVSFRRVLHKSRKQYDRKRLPKIREED